jgi:hypothetical protein
MRRLLLALLAASALATLVAAQAPTLYRWKDRSGKEHVTQTPPPPGATVLAVPQAQGGASAQTAATAAQNQNPVLKVQQPGVPGQDSQLVEKWKALDQRLEEARTKQDTVAIEAIVEGLFRESLWGGGLWAIPLLPVATLALLILLGWWAGSGLRQPWSATVVLVSILLGLTLGQLTLSRFLYRTQFSRLQSRLALLENHLGGKLPRATHRKAMQDHLRSLDAASALLAPPWAFLLECRSAEDTMIKVALDP